MARLRDFKAHMLTGAPASSAGAVHSAEWMTSANFLRFIRHFIQYVRCSLENKVLLILDINESLCDVNVLRLCKESGIVSLTPHLKAPFKENKITRRIKAKSTILTDTPNKEEIELAHQLKWKKERAKELRKQKREKAKRVLVEESSPAYLFSLHYVPDYFNMYYAMVHT